MQSYTAHIDQSPDPHDLDVIHGILHEFNLVATGIDDRKQIAVILRDQDNQIVGGLHGYTHWGWLHVSLLVIASGLRHKGYGSELLSLAEHEAVTQGCKYAYVDTFDFQALAFYEKRGYTVFAVLNDYAGRHNRYFLQKSLPTP